MTSVRIGLDSTWLHHYLNFWANFSWKPITHSMHLFSYFVHLFFSKCPLLVVRPIFAVQYFTLSFSPLASVRVRSGLGARRRAQVGPVSLCVSLTPKSWKVGAQLLQSRNFNFWVVFKVLCYLPTISIPSFREVNLTFLSQKSLLYPGPYNM